MKRILTLIGALIFVSACGRAPSSERDGQTLTFISGTPVDTLDPQGTSWLVDFRMIETLFEPLLKVHPDDMELHPAAAESWEVSDDGRVYTFHLRPEAKWSNGDPVKASDFVYAWQRAILPDSSADYTGLFFCIKGAKDFFDWRTQRLAEYAKVAAEGGGGSADAAESMWRLAQERFNETVGIEALDDLTLRVTLEEPTGYFLELCAFASLMPVHEATVAETVTLNPADGRLIFDTTYFNTPGRLVGNGAYVLDEARFKEMMVVVQNPHYWNKDAMGNKRIVQYVVENPTTSLLRYENGEVDWVPNFPIALDMSADLVAAGRDDVHAVPSAGTYFYGFNCRPEVDGRPNPLADWRVRRALSLAVDRQLIIDRVTRVGQPVAHTFVPAGAVVAGYDPPVEAGAGFDPDGARKLLAEAGYPDGKGIEGLSILYNTGGAHERVAQAIQQMWEEELGVRVTLEGVERTRFSARRRKGDYTIARGGWYGDYRDPTTFLDMFRKDDGNNDAKYLNPQYDALLAQAAREPDAAKRMKLLRDAEVILLHDQPLMPIYQYITIDLFDPQRVKGLYPNEWSTRRLETVRVVE